MKEKYAEKKENQLRLLAENRIESGQYTIFDHNARVITRKKIDGENCLVIINSEGETIVITLNLEIVLIVCKPFYLASIVKFNKEFIEI